MSQNVKLGEKNIGLINLVEGSSLTDGCQKCSEQKYFAARQKLSGIIQTKRKEAEQLLAKVPLASVQTPPGWQFHTLGLVTAQTVSGTGLFSDVTSAFTDLFGTQSGTYNHKLRNAENMCRASLQAQAFQMGGNAIVGIDVDYAEVGGARAMLMVCMTGTAVAVENLEAAGSELPAAMQGLTVATAELKSLVATAREHGVFAD